MTSTADAALLLRHLDEVGINGSLQITRGWQHIGAVIVDAVLQRRQRYKQTVRPRVENLVSMWPDADTTSGFRRRINEGGLSTVIRWKSEERLTQIEAILTVLEESGIETVEQLHNSLTDVQQRVTLRSALRTVKHVGPKTLDYFDILTGLSTAVAVDVRIKRFVIAAGILDLSYSHVSNVIHKAARIRGWRPGDLDAAMWNA